MIGRTLSHYQIIELLGEGAAGVVYKARDLTLDRLVAIKILSLGLSAPGRQRERFAREARAAAALNHPNVAQVYETGEVDGLCFIVMEHIEGRTLESAAGRISIREVISLGTQIADGLGAAHAKGIVHRDIKPSNLMVRDDGRAEITDFGLAHLPGLSKLTSTGTSVGTIAYMSPEQVKGIEPDPRSDMFSLGVVLYQLATGVLPFNGTGAASVLYQIANEEPVPIASVSTDVNPAFARIVMRCLERDPAARPSAVELAEELRSLERERAQLALTAQSHHKLRPGPSSLWRKVALATAAAGSIALLGLGILNRRAGAIDSIAVLPFVNAGADTSAEYLSDGITENLIDNLSQLPKLKVIARSSILQFRGGGVDPNDVGRRLGTRAVLTGDVVERAGQMQISVELIDTRDGRHLWGQRYHQPISELQEVQHQISTEITDQLRYRLSGQDRERLTKRATRDQEAYELYMKGLFEWNRQINVSVAAAAGYFQRAIARDATYALAYARLADTYWWMANFRPDPTADAKAAREAVKKALSIDPNLAEAHTAMAQILWFYDHEWIEAENEFKRAIHDNPGYEPARTWYAYFLLAQLRVDEAEIQAKRAHELDPLSEYGSIFVGATPFYRGQYEEASRAFQQIIDRSPESTQAHFWLAFAQEQLGHYDVAARELRTHHRLDAGPNELAELGRVYALAGKPDSAMAVLEVLAHPPGGAHVSDFFLAKIYAALGDENHAYRLLDHAIDSHDTSVPWLKADPDFAAFHKDPRYHALLKRLKLEI